MALSADQQQSLHRARLQALARSHFPSVTFTPENFPGGSMLVADAVALTLLADDNTLAAMGGALAKAPDDADLHLVVDEDRDALLLAAVDGFDPAPTVWTVSGTDFTRRDQATAPRLTGIAAAEIPTGEPLVELLRSQNVEVLNEGGSIVGEVLGLEVARIGPDSRDPDGGPRLHVGVGAYDQEAFAAINPDMAPPDALRAVVDEVRALRRAGADPHPVNRLVRERWVRALVIEDPESIGLRRLAPIGALAPRRGLRDVVPAAAVGTDPDGAIVLVVCSTGVDFSAVPTAAALAGHVAADRIVLVVPARDQYPHLERMIARLTLPTLVIDAPVPWEPHAG